MCKTFDRTVHVAGRRLCVGFAIGHRLCYDNSSVLFYCQYQDQCRCGRSWMQRKRRVYGKYFFRSDFAGCICIYLDFFSRLCRRWLGVGCRMDARNGNRIELLFLHTLSEKEEYESVRRGRKFEDFRAEYDRINCWRKGILWENGG